MTDPRMDSIETVLAHHEKQIQDLHEMITRQWDEIDQLKLRLKRATDQLHNIASSESEDRDNMSVSEVAALDKPPHY